MGLLGDTLVDIRIAPLRSKVELIIRDGEALAEVFFRYDPSSERLNGYDAWVMSRRSPADLIVNDDISVINNTMRARSRRNAWAQYTSTAERLPTLAAIGQTWDLFSMSDNEWARLECRSRIAALLQSIRGPYRNLSATTKVLHIKRPLLIPICDSRVVEMLGGSPEVSHEQAALLIAHFRKQGRANLVALETIKEHLSARGIHRTHVRIMDALLWMSHPGSWGSKAYQHLECAKVSVALPSEAAVGAGTIADQSKLKEVQP